MGGSIRQLINLGTLCIVGCVLIGCASSPPIGAPIEQRGEQTSAPKNDLDTPEPAHGRGIESTSQLPEAIALAPPVSHPTTHPATRNPAVAQLSTAASTLLDRQDHAGAASILERALAIDGSDAEVWHLLARARAQAGKMQEASLMAERCNALAGDAKSLLHRNWLLIARIERARGASEAETAARRRAERYAPLP